MASMVDIPALERSGRVVIPPFRIGRSVERRARTALDACSSAPAAAQFMHAYSSSGEFRQGIERDKPEWFADFISYSIKHSGKVIPEGFLYAHLVQRPETLHQRKGKIHEPGYGLWAAEGGTRIGVELPPIGIPIPDRDGTLYNPETGLPVLTTRDRARRRHALAYSKGKGIHAPPQQHEVAKNGLVQPGCKARGCWIQGSGMI